MEPKDYIVTEISGEYATLTDIVTNETLFIALALLPFGTDIGTKLHYEMLDLYGVSDIHRKSFLKSWYSKNE